MAGIESELIAKCKALYTAMLQDAQSTPEGLIWIGATTNLLREISENGSSSNYSQVIGALTDMQCITQIRKGGGKTHSAWRLDRPPSMELSNLISTRRNNPRASRNLQLEQQVQTLNERVLRLEQDQAMLIRFLNEKYKADLASGVLDG